jgi:phosphate transport system permease protein
VYRNIRQPLDSQINRGFTGALVLMLIVLTLFAVARYVGRDRAGHTTRRQRRRNARLARSRLQEASR